MNTSSSIVADEIGAVEVRRNKTVSIDKTIEISGGDSNLQFLGFNGQLAEISVPVNAGKSFTIYLGGKNLDPQKIKIGSGSAAIEVVKESVVSQDFGSETSAVSFTVNISKKCFAGDYSLYVETEKGKKEYIPGALSVEAYSNPWSNYTLSED